MQQLLLLSPGCMHLLPEVQWSDRHTICWHGGSVCTFPSLPWALLPGNALISHPCAHLVTVCVIGTRKAPAIFFLLPPAFDTMFIPTFQPVPWQQVSAYWVTCLTPSVEPAVERPAQRWRQVGELCTTQTTQEQHLFFIWQRDGTGLSWEWISRLVL